LVKGIQQKALSDKKFGAVPLNYRKLKAPREYSVIDYVEQPLAYYQEISKKANKRKPAEIEDNYIQQDDSDVSTKS